MAKKACVIYLLRMPIHSLREHFLSGDTRSREARIKALSALESLIRENQEAICQALYLDLRKPRQEALVGEIFVTLEEISVAKKNLRKWMRPEHRPTPLVLWPARSRVYWEPLGVVLIIGPWNYPFHLALAPLVGALAAGNCAVVKPSELTPHTSRLLAELVAKYFAPELVHVVEGGVAETTALLKEKFDHIFFTGSTAVGKIIMQAAAPQLIPVTLELGGKSPVIIMEDADLDLAARRIAWGKFNNAGQTCVAPDYVYAHESVRDELLRKLKESITAQFGAEPRKSESFARIVNERNFHRLMAMIQAEKVVIGGSADLKDLYIAPTILRDVSWDDPVMQEEIFGPILPVHSFTNREKVFSDILSRPKPLAAYLFARSSDHHRQFIERLSFGGGCINDVLVHLGNPHLPFGGVGESGMGRYHGWESFKVFSHAKSVMHRYSWLDLSARYAPYTERKLNLIRRFFA